MKRIVTKLTADDWSVIHRQETVTLGKITLYIRPVSLMSLEGLFASGADLFFAVREAGITQENWTELAHIKTLLNLADTISPEVLEEFTQLDRDDVRMLPLDKLMELAVKVAKVNIQSRADMEKNWKELVGMLGLTEADQTNPADSRKKKQ